MCAMATVLYVGCCVSALSTAFMATGAFENAQLGVVVDGSEGAGSAKG